MPLCVNLDVVLSQQFTEKFNESLNLLKDAGAEIVEVSCPSFEYAIAAYLIILAPGPSVLFIVARAIIWGKKIAVATAATGLANRAIEIGRAHV